MPYIPSSQPEENDNADALANGQLPDTDVIEPQTEAAQLTNTPSSEARGETNGGPLGCCLGIVVGLLLTLSIAIVSRLYATPLFGLLHGNLSITVRLIMVFVGIGLAIAFGYLGWKIGRRAFREYELSPTQKQRLARLEKAQRRKRRKQRQRRHTIMP